MVVEVVVVELVDFLVCLYGLVVEIWVFVEGGLGGCLGVEGYIGYG